MSAFKRIPPYTLRGAVLSADEYASLLQWVLANEAALSPSLVTGDVHRPSGRSARSFYGEAPWKPWLAQRIGALLPGILPELGMPPFAPSDFEIELVAYDDQCFIGRHRDTGTGATRHKRDRVVSMVYYLHREPRGFSGGALRLLPVAPSSAGEAAYADIVPVQNGLVAFPSWAIHEVLPVHVTSRRYEDARFAINVWAQRNQSLQNPSIVNGRLD